MPTMTRTRRARIVNSVQRETRAERLASAIREMPIESVRERIASARGLSDSELVARQRKERRERAAAAVARLRTL